MDLLALLRVMARRWYLALPLTLVSLLVAFLAYSRVSPVYEARGTLLLFAPATSSDEEGRANPYLLYGNLKVPANVISEVVAREEIRQELAAGGATADYALGTDALSIAPVVIVSATGSDAAALRTVVGVMAMFDRELRKAQEEAGAPPRTWITTRVVTPPGDLTEQFGGKFRVVAVVLFLGGSLTLIVTFGAEALARARRRYTARDDDEWPGAAPVEEVRSPAVEPAPPRRAERLASVSEAVSPRRRDVGPSPVRRATSSRPSSPPPPAEPVVSAPPKEPRVEPLASRPHPYLSGRGPLDRAPDADGERCALCGTPMASAAEYRQHLDTVHEGGSEAGTALGRKP